MHTYVHGWTDDALRYVLPPIKKLVTFLFWTATKTNYVSKCLDFQKKLIDTVTKSNSYLKFKEWKWYGCTSFWGCFSSSWRPSQISPTADFDGAAIPPLIFFMHTAMELFLLQILAKQVATNQLILDEISMAFLAHVCFSSKRKRRRRRRNEEEMPNYAPFLHLYNVAKFQSS